MSSRKFNTWTNSFHNTEYKSLLTGADIERIEYEKSNGIASKKKNDIASLRRLETILCNGDHDCICTTFNKIKI